MNRRDETKRKCIIFVRLGGLFMGQLAFLKMFLLVSIPTDINDIYKCIEIAYSGLTAKENEMLLSAIDKHWEFINDQISRTFRGERTKVKDLGK